MQNRTTRARKLRGPIGIATIALVVPCALSLRAAEPPPVQLVWTRGAGAAGCSSDVAISERVSQRLGRNPFAVDAKRTIHAKVRRTGKQWVLRVQLRDDRGKDLGSNEYTSESDTCESIESAAVLAISLIIDPNARSAASASASASASAVLSCPPPPPAPACPSCPPPKVERVLVMAPVTASPPRLPDSTFTLHTGVAAGLVPGASPMVGLSASLPLDARWSLTGNAMWVAESKPSDDRFSFSLTAFGAGVCRGMPIASTWLGGCASAWLGTIPAVVYSLRPTDPGDRLFAAISAGPFVRGNLYRGLHAELGADLFVPLVRRSFTVAGWQDPVWKQPAVGAAIHFGLGMHFR